MQTRVVVLAGAPGVGKSVVGAALAERLGWVMLDLDVVAPLPFDGTRDERYAVLVRVGLACAREGAHVILVAPFTAEVSTPVRWGRFRSRFGAADVRLVVLHLTEDLRERRLRERGACRDAGRPSSHPHRCHPAVDAVHRDAARPVDENVDALVQRLRHP